MPITELPEGINNENCLFLEGDENIHEVCLGDFNGWNEDILYFNHNDIYYHFEGEELYISECSVVDLSEVYKKAKQSKINKKDFIKENNLYRDEDKLIMQVPYILSGATYKLPLSGDEIHELRKTHRAKYDKIKEDMEEISIQIGKIALKAAREIEDLVLKLTENFDKNV
jgi:hypothetical protein